MFFVYKKLSLGGAETLILRIAQSLQKKEACRILCSSITLEARAMFDKSDIQIDILNKWEAKRLAYIINSEKALFYSPRDFILVCDVLQSRKIINNCFLYVVHFNNVGIHSKSFAFLNKKLKKDAKSLFDIFEKSGRVIFMDDMCANYYRKIYGYSDDRPLRVLRLPLLEPNKLYIQTQNDNVINILSVARAEFPFKGYLVGLIKEMQKFHSKSNIILTVISYGDGLLELKKLAAEEKKNKNILIKVIDKVDYNRLNDYYRNSDIYIGMGTTIIEAASNGSVSIPVLPYTYELIADKFFYENPKCIALEKACDVSAIELIKIYINASNEERLEMKRKSYKAFKDNYSMSYFLKTLANFRFEQVKFKVPKITKMILKFQMNN